MILIHQFLPLPLSSNYKKKKTFMFINSLSIIPFFFLTFNLIYSLDLIQRFKAISKIILIHQILPLPLSSNYKEKENIYVYKFVINHSLFFSLTSNLIYSLDLIQRFKAITKIILIHQILPQSSNYIYKKNYDYKFVINHSLLFFPLNFFITSIIYNSNKMFFL